MKKILKTGFLLLSMAIYSGCVAHVQTTPGPQEPAPAPSINLRPLDLKVLQLIMSPDPVREGQRVVFQAVVANRSPHSAKAHFFIKDRNEIVTQVYDVFIRPGENQIVFPQTRYRFFRNENCFMVEVDIERTRKPVDVVREFCVRRNPQGWTMGSPRIGPLVIEDLEFSPDPALPGREVRFRAILRNEGSPFRADIRILDRDQVVTQVNDVFLPRGTSHLLFPNTHYKFQRFDHCFTVVVDVDRTTYRVDAVRQFCAKPTGWTLNPPPQRP